MTYKTNKCWWKDFSVSVNSWFLLWLYHVIVIKVGLSPSKKSLFYLLHWKLFRNAFHFILKALFVLKIWLQTITIQVVPNISRSKGNQTMKFDQSTEHNKRNICLQKLCRKCGSQASSRLLFVFLKSFIWGKSKWSAA